MGLQNLLNEIVDPMGWNLTDLVLKGYWVLIFQIRTP